MAVSQYLRPESLIDAVRSHFTPDVVRNASSLVGESETSTRGALNASVPSVLSGLVNMVSSRDGAGTLSGLIRDGGFGAAAENVGSLFSGGSATNNVLGAGQQLMGKIFGNNSSAVADVVSKSSGVSSSSATKLLSLSGPLVLGVLGKTTHGLDSSGLANTLLNSRSEIDAAAPAGLSKILATERTAAPSAVVTEPVASNPVRVDRYTEPTSTPAPTYVAPEPERKAGMGWLPWLIVGLGILGLLLWMRGRSATPRTATSAPATTTNQPAESINLPNGQNISVPRGSINYDLATFLGDHSAGAVPKTFVFDNLNFESATTQLTPQSVPTVNNLAAVLKAYPNARVELAGHTDNTGNPQANQTLSLDRANAVKSMLVNQGVNADQITTNGYGDSRPVSSNDSPEGRERNRRLELIVNSK